MTEKKLQGTREPFTVRVDTPEEVELPQVTVDTLGKLRKLSGQGRRA